MDIRNDYSGNDFGKYYLIQKLGNGGFGSVYRVFDKILSVEKALKILEVNNPNEAYKLFSEAAIPYKCQHNNVIKINGGEIIQFNGELLFVIDMDLANGMSIESVLKKSYLSVNKSFAAAFSLAFDLNLMPSVIPSTRHFFTCSRFLLPRRISMIRSITSQALIRPS